MFDVGGVLIEKPIDFEEMATIAGTPGGNEFRNAFLRHRDVYDAGGRATDFWASVVMDLKQPNPTPAIIERLIAAECQRWQAPADDMVTWIRQLHDAGYQLAILSNAPFELAEVMKTSELGKSFDSMTFSCDIGICKPDSGAYRAALRAMGASPTTTRFFDDRIENVEAAIALALDAHIWPGRAGFESILSF